MSQDNAEFAGFFAASWDPCLRAVAAGTVPAPGHLKPGDLRPGNVNRIIDHAVTVIDPAAVPSGTELFFGYFSSVHALFFDLVYTRSYTCSNGPRPPADP